MICMAGCATQPGTGERLKSLVASRPNIVLIMADDMGFSDLGCYGSEIATPNIDRLAKDGMRFTQFYNSARCCPTRASLMTGLYPHQAGIGHMLGKSPNGLYEGGLAADCVTLAEVLSQSGYATYMSGKWHLTPWPNDAPDAQRNWPVQRGFNHFYGTLASIRSYYNPPSLARNNKLLDPPNGDFHYTDAINENAVKFIDDHKADEPFFVYVAHTAPHWPMHARPEDVQRYKGQYLAGWDRIRQKRRKRLVELGLIDAAWPAAPRDERGLAWDQIDPKLKPWLDHRMAVYAAMIEQMDRGIGKIIDALERKGQLDNTLIVFLSDNGGCAEEIGPKGRAKHFPLKTRDGKVIRLGNAPAIDPGDEDTYASYGLEWANASNTPFRHFKSFAHEGGIATPLIVHWPGKVKPGMTHQVGHIIDIMPTFVDVAGGKYPKTFNGHKIQSVEGKSLLGVLAGGRRRDHQALFWEHEGNRAVRAGKWKLVSRFPGDWELYDLKADRLETRDLSADQPQRVKQLEALYMAWAKRSGVKPWKGAQTAIGWPDKGRYAR